MRPRDLFGVAVRAIGIWWVTQGCYWAYWAFWKDRGGATSNPYVSAGVDVGSSIGFLLLGAILLVFADHIVRLVYGPQIRTVLGGEQEDDALEASRDSEPSA